VRNTSDRQVWRQRIIAFATAYLVAMSGLLASFGAARAAADGTFDPLAAICHHSPAGQSDPFGGRSNGNVCIDCCCVGCLVPLAALPPPPASLAPLPVAIIHRVVPVALITLSGTRLAKSHRARAPPYVA
jgi:hypothetical protein